MFYCDKCKRLSKPYEKMNKIVTKKREKVYYGLRGKKNFQKMVEVGRGWEIAEEITVCSKCVEDMNDEK